MTLALTGVAPDPLYVNDSTLVWEAFAETAKGTEHTVQLPHEPGDPAPTWQDVRDHLAELDEEHDLHGARLAQMLTKREYLHLFTRAERRRIKDTDYGIGEWAQAQREAAGDAMTFLQEIEGGLDLGHPDTIALVEGLAATGLLDHETRAEEILSASAPNT